jgi:hypothetical protein
MIAASKGHIGVVQVLPARGATDIYIQGSNSRRASSLVASTEYSTIVELLATVTKEEGEQKRCILCCQYATVDAHVVHTICIVFTSWRSVS